MDNKQLWEAIFAYNKRNKEKDHRLQIAESQLKKLRELIPDKPTIPKPTEVQEFFKTIRDILWGAKT